MRIFALFAALLVCAWPTANAQATADDIVGIYASRTEYPSGLAGELRVRRTGDTWTASVGSTEREASRRGDSITIDFGSTLGQYRGVINASARLISGFWIQPAGVIYGQPYSTPTTLQSTAPWGWRGNIVPFAERYSLYLVIRKGTDGRLTAVFRNPELNAFGRFSQYRVSLRADSVIFTAGPDTLKPMFRTIGRLTPIPQDVRGAQSELTNGKWQITLPAQFVERPVTLDPSSEALAVGLFARSATAPRYSYRAPLPSSDGWVTARAADVGMDENKLAELVRAIVDTVSTAPRAPLIHSVLVARHGKLVLEEYFFGYGPDQEHDTRSAGKTLSAIMMGTAMYSGISISPATKLASLTLPEAPFANPDPRKQAITLGQVMTHSTGLACDDDDDASPGNEGTLQAQRTQANWWKYILDVPMLHDPGTHRAYCSGSMNLMSAALTRATHSWLPAYFDAAIARPLQFGRYHYNLSPTFDAYLGGGIELLPRDFLKLGQLWVSGGLWNGRRLVSKEWVTTSTSKQIEWPRQSENVSAGSDGFAWHLNTITLAGRSYREYEANGNGGQLLMVFPELDMVVVFTGGSYMSGGVWGRWRDVLTPRFIIGAVRD